MKRFLKVLYVSKRIYFLLVIIFLLFFISTSIFAQDNNLPIPNVNINLNQAKNPRQVANSLEILLLISLLSLAPSLIISLTSYVRLIIVFDFIKRGLGTQQMPPTQVMAGLALFLTVMIMMPTFKQINENAIQPYMDGKISLNQLYYDGVKPLRNFMFKQTRPNDIALFLKTANLPRPRTTDDVPTYVLVPSFILSELRTAFSMGILIMLPFMIIDMIVSATLMSMGMIMLPPVMISLPIKIIVFVLVDGWGLIVGNLVKSFGG